LVIQVLRDQQALKELKVEVVSQVIQELKDPQVLKELRAEQVL